MGLKQFMQTLSAEGIHFEEHHLRYAIKRGWVSQPKLNPSLKYVFEKKHLEQCRKLFGQRKKTALASA